MSAVNSLYFALHTARKCGGLAMPRPDSSRTLGAYSSSGRGYAYKGLSVEATAGIAILAIIIAVVFVIGCWYYKKRSGYKILKNQHFGSAAIRSLLGGSNENAECKVPLQDYSTIVVPGAPPAYEKISSESQPPPYSP
ncbi:melanoma antigen recognized by T-cells 1 isoform X1 [Xenopus laevis]|uniref:Melanoma antigen recognized by T-cells 1 isoform X1 n=3 Tax=Xenopus laevis TaxID=8355 RepID=A0A8J0U9P6_XENLA|nr:melanoma antigen recognized by T-cells 1 isoform X1 [Xenopus laevis]